MADIDKYKRAGHSPSVVGDESPAKPQKEEYAYEAFKVLDTGQTEFLTLVRADELVRCLNYNGLVDIAHDGELGTQVGLVFSFGSVVKIYGRNLTTMTLALCFRRVETITQFSDSRWPKLKDDSAPIVTKITIETRDMADSATQIERAAH